MIEIVDFEAGGIIKDSCVILGELIHSFMLWLSLPWTKGRKVPDLKGYYDNEEDNAYKALSTLPW